VLNTAREHAQQATDTLQIALNLAIMEDGSTQTVSLSDYKGQYVALFFYPKDFTFV
jgi:alkyl hydroperoxide reductase subunit AhpC